MKNFENLHFVKKRTTTIRRITGVIAIIIFPVICFAPSYEFGQSELYQSISEMIVYVNTTLYFFSSWIENKLKNVY
jgi:hypothetical protein